jgi:hypothetical protein
MSNEAMKNTGVKNEVGNSLLKIATQIDLNNIDLNTIADCFISADSIQPQQIKHYVETIKNNLSHSSNELQKTELQEIINVVNNVVTSTTNGTSSVQNLEDLKAFLNQAIPAWQNAMQNQTVFQQQFYRFPSHM